MSKLLKSSTGNGIKMRIKSLAFLIIPIVNIILKGYGIDILESEIDLIIDSVFVLLTAGFQVYGWWRALK
jgi:hypothetical protein